MEAISNSELLELILIQRQSLDLQYQFWLTITFALVAATFVAGARLHLPLRLFVLLLYVLATGSVMSRYMLEVAEIAVLIDEAVARGVLESLPLWAFWFRVVTVLAGSIGAVSYLLYEGRQAKGAPA